MALLLLSCVSGFCSCSGAAHGDVGDSGSGNCCSTVTGDVGAVESVSKVMFWMTVNGEGDRELAVLSEMNVNGDSARDWGCGSGVWEELGSGLERNRPAESRFCEP